MISGVSPLPRCVTLCQVALSLRGRGQSPVLPFACCVGSPRSVGRCGLCSCWCRFRVSGAQQLVSQGCAGCCRGRVAVSLSLLPSPLHASVIHHPPRCVSLGTRSVGLLFLDWTLDSHPFLPSHAVSGRCVLWAAVVFALAEPSSWRTGAVLLAAGVVSQPLLPTPLRILVIHHLPCYVSVGMWSVGLLFRHGALDSHPFCPSHAASGGCVLAAAAACVPAGVVSASAEHSSWHTRVVLVSAGVILWFLLPTPLRTQVVHPIPCHVSTSVRPNTSLKVRTALLGSLWWPKGCSIPRVRQLTVQPAPWGSLWWPKGRCIPCTRHQQRHSTALQGSLRWPKGCGIPCTKQW